MLRMPSFQMYTYIGITIGSLPTFFIINSARSSLINLMISLTSNLFLLSSVYLFLENSTISVCICLTSDEYTNHLDSICTLPMSWFVVMSILNRRVTQPSCAMIWRALITYSPLRCPLPFPSMRTVSRSSFSSAIRHQLSNISMIHPFSFGMRIFSSGIH